MRSSKNRNLTLYGVHRNPTVRFGAVSTCHKSCGAARCYDGAVRCGCEKQDILRCGSVRFSDVVNPTMRFGYILRPTVRFGALCRYRNTCGAVQCGFHEGTHSRAQCGGVNRTEPYRADRTNRTVKNSDIYVQRTTSTYEYRTVDTPDM